MPPSVSPRDRFEELPSPTASTSSLPPMPTSSQNTRRRDLEREREEEESEEEEEESVWYTPSELQVILFLPSSPSPSPSPSLTTTIGIQKLKDSSSLLFFWKSQDILQRSTSLKSRGNTEFGRGEYEIALLTYRDGLVELPLRTCIKVKVKGGEKEADPEVGVDSLLQELELEDTPEEKEEEEEEEELRELRSILFANVAACLLKLKRWKEAVEACNDALEDNPSYVKALHRRALASEAIGSWSSLSSALEDYKTISTLPDIPSSLAITAQQAIKRLPGLIGIQQTKEKDEVMGKLKDLGNTVLGKFGFSTDNFKFVEQPGGGYSMNFER